MKTFYEMTAALKAATDRAEAAEAQVWELAELLSGAQLDTCEKWCRSSAGVVHVRFCEAVTAALAKLAEGERDLHGTV